MTFAELRIARVRAGVAATQSAALAMSAAAVAAIPFLSTVNVVLLFAAAAALLIGALWLRSYLTRTFNNQVAKLFARTPNTLDGLRAGNWELNLTEGERRKVDKYLAESKPTPLTSWAVGLRYVAAGILALALVGVAGYHYFQSRLAGGKIRYSTLLTGVVSPPGPEKIGQLLPAATDRLVRLLELEQAARRLKARSECFLKHETTDAVRTAVANPADLDQAAVKHLDELKSRIQKWFDAATPVANQIAELHDVPNVALKGVKGKLESSVAYTNRLGSARAVMVSAPSPNSLETLTGRLDDLRQSLESLVPALTTLLSELGPLLDQTFGKVGEFAGDPCLNDGFGDPGGGGPTPHAPPIPSPTPGPNVDPKSKPENGKGTGTNPSDPKSKDGMPSKPGDGTPKGEKGGGTAKDDKGGGTAKDDKGGGTAKSDKGGGTAKDDKGGGTAKDDTGGGTAKDDNSNNGKTGGQPPESGASSPQTSDPVRRYRRGQSTPDGKLDPNTGGRISRDIDTGIPVTNVPTDTTPPTPPEPKRPPQPPQPPEPKPNPKKSDRTIVDKDGKVISGKSSESATGRAGRVPILPPSK